MEFQVRLHHHRARRSRSDDDRDVAGSIRRENDRRIELDRSAAGSREVVHIHPGPTTVDQLAEQDGGVLLAAGARELYGPGRREHQQRTHRSRSATLTPKALYRSASFQSPRSTAEGAVAVTPGRLGGKKIL